jgi:hypothetical protein
VLRARCPPSLRRYRSERARRLAERRSCTGVLHRACTLGPTEAAHHEADRRDRNDREQQQHDNVANSAPRPKWLISAAIPRPAASAAIGPIHERRGAAGGVAAAVGAGAGCAVGAAGFAGTASGAARGGTLRCMPTAPPPPMRRASATSGTRAADAAQRIGDRQCE